MPQPLSAKEGSLFRQVIRNYEDKQYKRGLKAAEQILRKNPKHGDTMAMKALIMNQQGKTEEAFALGKEALTADMKSHICWHVYGLLYRHQKNFEEAIKAYKFALRLEPESHQIQRDLALLQVQMRDYQGYIQSRTAMLQARPQLRQNWTALAVAHHLSGDLAQAEKVLTTYEESLKTPPSKTDFENSEAVMYKNTVIAETGDYQKALDHLEVIAKHNLDRLAVLELRALYLSKLDRKDDAAAAYRALIERNPEHPEYYDKLISALQIEPTDQAARKAIYDEYAKKNPRSDAAKRLPLDFLDGDAFKEAAEKYLTYMLDRGVPSTFANLKHLYADAAKKETLCALALQYLQKQEEASAPNEDQESLKGKSAALYYLAQHYNYHLSRDLAKALEYVDEGIKIVPKNVEFHMTKARIWKHHGNTEKAAQVMDQARDLDLKDRYINSKAAKYQLRDNQTAKALQTMALFTRNDTPGGPLQDLLDMQCIWYLTEDGEAQVRVGNVGLALKRFHAVYNIFDVWQEDQFDFHSFTLRKGQIRAYVDMLRWEDSLREHPFYTRAALGAVALYIGMYDARKMLNGVNGTGKSAEDDAEKKKAAKKAKKEAQKAEREAAEKASKQDPNKAKAAAANGEPVRRDEDPNGFRLAATQEPLAEATKFLAPLLQYSPKHIDGQIAGFEVYIRREKYLLALRCLNAALALDPENATVHEQVVRFRQALNTKLESLPPKVAEVLKSEFTAIDGSTDLKKYNAEFQSKHAKSAPHVISAIKTSAFLGADQAQCAQDLVGVLAIPDVHHEQAEEVLGLLRQWRSDEAEPFKGKAHEKWPEVTAFA